jgi:restriction endonuclease S subunit
MAMLLEPSAHIARQIMAIRGNKYVYLPYVKIYLESYIPTLQAMAKSMIPGIARENILHAIISLPPLSEQKRIVDKVANFNLLIDKLFNLVA